MIDRDRIRSLAMAIRDHAAMLESFANAPDSTPYMLEKEALGRANLIEGRLAQLRSAAAPPPISVVPARHRFQITGAGTTHVLGDRPTDEDSAA